jgi:hypothetical protein
MITAALDAITSRKWLMELIVAALVALAVWWFCEHLISVGVQKQKDADAKAYAQLVIAKAKEEGRLQALADKAEHAHDEELTQLRTYRDSQPLHGSLRIHCPASVSSAASTDRGDDEARSAAAAIQSLPAGSTGASGPGSADVLHLLDILAGRADTVSATLREYQLRANGK